jgi:hypothetical protein
MNFPITTSIRSRLGVDERALRQALLDCMIAAQGPVALAEAGAALGWSAERTAAAADGLRAKKLAAPGADGRVQYAYPVSAVPTAHQVTLADGRTLYAMCAIDSLGCYFTFGQPVQVDARCHVCGAPLRIAVTGSGHVESQPPGVHVTHVDLNKYDDWAGST